MKVADLKNYIKPGARGHLIGIGGVSMSPLAEVLAGMGVLVSGSDLNDNPSVCHLRSLGIEIHLGHRAENIAGAEFIVRTAAVHDDNPEISAARAAGIPVFERAQAWGFLMQSYRNALCISGTHGKTTTTSMSTHILMAAEQNPTVMIGGTLPLLKAGHRIGGGDTIVMESCEYYNSFHSFSPTVAVILNVEADHLDFFRDLEDVKQSFRKFASLVPEETGCVIINGDDANTVDTVRGLDRRIVTFGLSASNDVRADQLTIQQGLTSFDLIYQGKPITRISLKVPGTHNVLNALAAAASALVLGLEPSAIQAGLGEFTGAGRRFEYKGSVNGARVYDDYAHHPGELHALLDAVSSLDYDRIILAFQPHTYTRTKALFPEFVQELARADLLFLAEIFAAREINTVGISSRDLADQIPGSTFCATFPELEAALKAVARPGDIILTVGAGDIFKVGEAIAAQQ
ncbi:MAG: UDP-N-acetylmuramate--L-alanine ligase [Lentisphaeria bacterium]|nr:UDP-N-acetylmuramate--L-alanine ligase [Lentisphaeria bacterium]